MPTLMLEVGLVLERRKATSPWLDLIWEAHAVLAEPAAAEPGAPLGRNGEGELIYAGRHALKAHTTETAHYRDNLNSGQPMVWVVMRPQADSAMPEIVALTCDPSEGEGYSQTGWDLVQAVPMPEPVAAALAAFVAEHHVERAFIKRKRDRADPEALALHRRGPEADRQRRAAEERS
jgi:Protein of unknown function (DUF3305)